MGKPKQKTKLTSKKIQAARNPKKRATKPKMSKRVLKRMHEEDKWFDAYEAAQQKQKSKKNGATESAASSK